MLATPMFGGGVAAGVPDTSLWIRETSIRGQLQFWWRATRGAACAPDELFAEHEKVWGSTETASPVEICLREVKMSDPQPCAKYEPKDGDSDGRLQLRWEQSFHGRDNPLPYALFPFQGELHDNRRTVKKPPARFVPGGSFILSVRNPARLDDEVDTAVWAWVNFGGIGARTRRGCGALFCKELAPDSVAALDGWFGKGAWTETTDEHEWPTLPPDFLVHAEPLQAMDAWKKAIGVLRRFRQSEGFARNPGQNGNRPGRSRYPEPEAIRQETGDRHHRHGPLPIPNDAFPRAELGLPIVFHFKDHGEPEETVLQPARGPGGEKRDRMASPLILKPLMLKSGQALSLIMRLRTPRLDGVELLLQKSGERLLTTKKIRDPALAKYKDSPLQQSPSGSALEAFLAEARKQGFTEVRR
jgi:CRISPR-associated protein Cmr1